MAVQEIILGDAPKQPQYKEVDLGSIDEPKNMVSIVSQKPPTPIISQPVDTEYLNKLAQAGLTFGGETRLPQISQVPPPTKMQKFKNLFVGEDAYTTAPPIGRMEEIDRTIKRIVRAPVRTFIKYGKGRLLNTPDIVWAGIKKMTPDSLWDEEVKKMNLTQAVDWAMDYNPSAITQFLGGTAEFVGGLQTARGLVGAKKMPIGVNALDKALEIAKIAGFSKAGQELSKLMAEKIDPETDYQYEGAIGVIRDMGVMAGLSLGNSLIISPILAKVAQSSIGRKIVDVSDKVMLNLAKKFPQTVDTFSRNPQKEFLSEVERHFQARYGIDPKDFTPQQKAVANQVARTFGNRYMRAYANYMKRPSPDIIYAKQKPPIPKQLTGETVPPSFITPTKAPTAAQVARTPVVPTETTPKTGAEFWKQRRMQLTELAKQSKSPQDFQDRLSNQIFGRRAKEIWEKLGDAEDVGTGGRAEFETYATIETGQVLDRIAKEYGSIENFYNQSVSGKEPIRAIPQTKVGLGKFDFVGETDKAFRANDINRMKALEDAAWNPELRNTIGALRIEMQERQGAKPPAAGQPPKIPTQPPEPPPTGAVPPPPQPPTGAPPIPPVPPTGPISPKGKPIPQIAPTRGRIRVAAEKLYQSFINRFASIENITKRAQKLGMTIKPGENPTLRARGYLGMGRKAESVLEDKTYRITPEGKIQITGEGLRPILKDFESVIKPLGKVKVSELDLKDYLIARRTIEDLQRPKYEVAADIATPKQVAESQAKIVELQGKYGKNISVFDQTANRLYAYQKRVLHTLVEGGNLSEGQYKEILKNNPNYVPFDRIMDDIEGVSGVPKTQMPFTGARAPIKPIKGSEREIHDPIESIIKNTYRIMDAAERNTVARTIMKLQKIFPDEITPVPIRMRPIKVDPKEISTMVKTIRSKSASVMEDIRTSKKTAGGKDVPISGSMEKIKNIVTEALMKRGMSAGEAGNYIRKIESQAAGGKPISGDNVETVIRQIVKETQRTIIKEEPVESTIFRPSPFKPTGNIVEYFEGGKRKYAEVAPNLYDAMSGLNETSSGLLVNILSKPATWLRTGATITPEFITRNIIRDQQTALMQTSFGVRPFLDTIASIADIVGKTDIYYDWLRSGGAYSGFVELSRPQLKLAYKELMGRGKLLKKLNIISDMQDISQLGEQATRLAVYEAALEKGKVPIEAGFESREATVDFGRRGSKTKNLNKITAFFNAGVQGTDKTVRTMVKSPFSATAKGVAAITIPSLILYMINRNDPDYQEIPRWQKDLFWIVKVPGTKVFARIPKPFLYGQIFGSLPERFFEYIDTKDKSAFNDLTKSMYDSVLPTSGDPTSGLMATGLKPLIENAANYNFFRQQPILPEGVKELTPAEQYTKGTSETIKEVGKILNYSPAKIENFMQGYIGGSARYITGAGDFLINKIKEADGVKVPQKPTDITKYPGLYGLTIRSPLETGYAESIDKFYKNRDKLVAQQQTFDKMIKEGRKEEAAKFFKNNPKMGFAKEFSSASRQMSELNKRVDDIMMSEILNPKQKADKIYAIEKQRVSLAKSVNKLAK